jgi:hypothetical protein
MTSNLTAGTIICIASENIYSDVSVFIWQVPVREPVSTAQHRTSGMTIVGGKFDTADLKVWHSFD